MGHPITFGSIVNVYFTMYSIWKWNKWPENCNHSLNSLYLLKVDFMNKITYYFRKLLQYCIIFLVRLRCTTNFWLLRRTTKLFVYVFVFWIWNGGLWEPSEWASWANMKKCHSLMQVSWNHEGNIWKDIVVRAIILG